MFWKFFFYLFPFIPSHKTPGAWSSGWKAELVLIFIFDYFLCLKRQEAPEATWIPAPLWNPSFLQDALPPPTLGSDVRNSSLSPPIVTAGTTGAAGSQGRVGCSHPQVSRGVLHTNQKSKCRQIPEGSGCARRLSPTHAVSQLTTGLTVGTWSVSHTYEGATKHPKPIPPCARNIVLGGCSSMPTRRRKNWNYIRTTMIQKISAILMSLSMPLLLVQQPYHQGEGNFHSIWRQVLKIDPIRLKC